MDIILKWARMKCDICKTFKSAFFKEMAKLQCNVTKTARQN